MAFLAVIMTLYVVAAPFTKVEESFNVQAMHDMLFHGLSVSQYDHFEFPGVVPRTFVGALAISTLCSPFLVMAKAVGLPLVVQKWMMLHVVRIVLGALIAWSYHRFATAVANLTRRPLVGTLFLAFTAVQFHATFWTSRPLPNTFALVLTNAGLASYLDHLRMRSTAFPRATTAWLTIALIVLRFELVLLAASLFVVEVVVSRRTPLRAIPSWISFALVSAIGPLALTLAVDSFFWHAPWMWPELHVLLFNTVANQSHRWGTSPWYAYFAAHLPKLLLGALPWTLVGNVTGRRNDHARSLALVAVVYVGLYSALPHKETRFIIYVVPLLNAVAAMGAGRAYDAAQAWRRAVAVSIALSLAASLAVSLAFAAISAWNYPGGDLMRCLAAPDSRPACAWAARVSHGSTVHVDVPVAQTGFSRFLESPTVRYSKQENLTVAERHVKFEYLAVVHDIWLREGERGELVGCVPCYKGVVRPWTRQKQQDGGETTLGGWIKVAPCACIVRADSKRLDAFAGVHDGVGTG
ncbi:dolichyl-P-Man:Man(7)GlcNAc(2)-PP-dolichol alpha-1,6-mannosyltransferase [Allomyces arbusculus]|nr:dolichyl-P-Man:Man(7)GlcNAc(2)-PP-dolichol alpha-1,6-mannosyltransferase [Allomyces arbusculus]